MRPAGGSAGTAHPPIFNPSIKSINNIKQFCSLVFSTILCAGSYAQNVGIGATSPLMPLHVSSSSDTAFVLLENHNVLNAGINAGAYFRTGGRYTGAIKTIGTAAFDARLAFFTFSTPNANSLQERLTISDDGKVGIGTATPSAMLDVNGTMRVRGNGAAGGNVLTSDATGNASWQPPAPAAALNTGFSVSANTSVTIGDDLSAVIPFNNKTSTYRFDDGNNFNVAGNAFVAPTTGVYSFTISAGVAAGAVAADGIIRLGVLVNGFSRNAPSSEMQAFSGKLLPRTLHLTVLLKLDAGDAVTAQIFNNTGASISTDTGNRCNFSGCRLY